MQNRLTELTNRLEVLFVLCLILFVLRLDVYVECIFLVSQIFGNDRLGKFLLLLKYEYWVTTFNKYTIYCCTACMHGIFVHRKRNTFLSILTV